jgi:hypothetical protein
MTMDDMNNRMLQMWLTLEEEEAFSNVAARAFCEMRGSAAMMRITGREALIDREARRVSWAVGPALSPVGAYLALRYFFGAKEKFPCGQQLPLRKLAGGGEVAESFRERVLDPMAERFGKNPVMMTRAGLGMGGRIVKAMGDNAVEVTVFPRVPVTCVVWAADGEMPPAANMYFDVTVTSHIDIEDVAMLGEWLLGELRKATEL